MGTHDCRVSTGIIKLKQGTTEDQVRQALGAFMSVHHLDYLAEAEKGNIEITETSLHFDLDILGYGGSSNESVKAFTESLAPIPAPITWLDVDGTEFRFMPSDALSQLRLLARGNGLPDDISDKAEQFCIRYGNKLDAILKTLTADITAI